MRVDLDPSDCPDPPHRRGRRDRAVIGAGAAARAAGGLDHRAIWRGVAAVTMRAPRACRAHRGCSADGAAR